MWAVFAFLAEKLKAEGTCVAAGREGLEGAEIKGLEKSRGAPRLRDHDTQSCGAWGLRMGLVGTGGIIRKLTQLIKT